MIATLFNAYTDHDPVKKTKAKPFRVLSFAEAQQSPDAAVKMLLAHEAHRKERTLAKEKSLGKGLGCDLTCEIIKRS